MAATKLTGEHDAICIIQLLDSLLTFSLALLGSAAVSSSQEKASSRLRQMTSRPPARLSICPSYLSLVPLVCVAFSSSRLLTALFTGGFS